MRNIFLTALIFISFFLLSVNISLCEERPVIPAVATDKPPVIDGDLSDECWKIAPSVSDFVIIDDSKKPSEQTTAWICYDQQNIYISFYCKDSQPNKIKAEQKIRGRNMGSDDRIEVDIDTFDCQNWDQIPWLDVSPIGTQYEVLQSGDVNKIEWRGDWNAEGKIVADGYQIEIAIPFSILKYDSQSTKMGIMFARLHSRTSKWWSSPNVSNNWDPKKFYVWDGLKLPECKQSPLFMGYTLLGTGEDSTNLKLGLDTKYSFNSRSTGLLTINPDFSNVEQQVDSVSYSYNERQLSDNRPFFQEGKQNLPGSDIFYTRRINEIDYGGKFVGKIGAYNIGAMSIFSPGGLNSNVIRLSRDLDGKGQIAIAGVSSDYGRFNGFTSQIAGDYRIYEKDKKRLSVYGNYGTADGPAGVGTGDRFELGTYYSAGPGKLEWGIQHSNIGKNYNPQLGIFPEPDINAWGFNLSMYKSPSKGKVEFWNTYANAALADHQNGSLFHNDISFGATIGKRNGTGISFGIGVSDRPPYNDNSKYLSLWWGGKTLYRGGNIGFSSGKMAGGDNMSWSIGQSYDLTDRLILSSGYEYSEIDKPSPVAYSSGQLITNLAYDIDDEKTISGRVVSKKNGKSNAYLAYRQRVRTGMDIYITAGDPNAIETKSSITVKLIKVL